MGSCKVIADTVERYVGATGRSFSDVTWLGERGPGQNGAHWSGARVRDRGDPGAGRFSVVDFGELANSRGTPCWIPDTAHRGGLGTVKRRGLFAGFKWLYRFILCVCTCLAAAWTEPFWSFAAWPCVLACRLARHDPTSDAQSAALHGASGEDK